MKRASILFVVLALLLSGCMSCYSLSVGGGPKVSAEELSAKIAAHYPRLGLLPASIPSDTFPLGGWHSNPHGGRYVGHAAKDQKLWIWVVPAPGSDDVSVLVEEIKGVVSLVAPEAIVEVEKSRSPDLR